MERETSTTVKLTISLPRELAEFAQRVAKETGRHRSRVIAELLEERRAKAMRESLIEGYRALAGENRRFAAEASELAAEVWNAGGPEKTQEG